MTLQEKLQYLRKKNGYSQEQLADKLSIARQTVSKWETGQAIPELSGLIQLSDLYGVPIDRIVKEDKECNLSLQGKNGWDKGSGKSSSDRKAEIVKFLLHAKKQTYAGQGSEVTASREASHDFKYQAGDFLYYDTYLGGEKFGGQEAVWILPESGWKPAWCMNYIGRVTGENFDLGFLREALYHVPEEMPYRGLLSTPRETIIIIVRLKETFPGTRDMKRFFIRIKKFMSVISMVENLDKIKNIKTIEKY